MGEGQVNFRYLLQQKQRGASIPIEVSATLGSALPPARLSAARRGRQHLLPVKAKPVGRGKGPWRMRRGGSLSTQSEHCVPVSVCCGAGCLVVFFF